MRAIAEYTLEFVIKTPPAQKREDEQALANLPGMLEAVKEDLRGLLPAGWEVLIYQEPVEAGRPF